MCCTPRHPHPNQGASELFNADNYDFMPLISASANDPSSLLIFRRGIDTPPGRPYRDLHQDSPVWGAPNFLLRSVLYNNEDSSLGNEDS